MPHSFKPYEVRVLEDIVQPQFTREEFAKLLESVSLTRMEYTHYGFYLSIEHPDIGERRAFSTSSELYGHIPGYVAGFVVFLKGCQITLEIFPINGKALPETFRNSDVELVDGNLASSILCGQRGVRPSE